MHFLLTTVAAAAVLASLIPTQSYAYNSNSAAASENADTSQSSSINDLVAKVSIPWKRFTLDNGLTVIVNEDRSAPIVSVQTWYAVGSKNDPSGSKGFAHLFEHLMFEGTENSPKSHFENLSSIGATGVNGITWFDRTVYMQVVPTAALEYTLYIESDRMGHMLGQISQEALNAQRGVVQNEKREGDNETYGLVMYSALSALVPEGHPYHHTPIGEMSDLDAASLEVVRNFYRENYVPKNAYLILSGDINEERARELAQKYFQHIPSGNRIAPVNAYLPTLPEPVTETFHERTTQTRISREWVTPHKTHEDTVALNIAAAILSDISGARLKQALVEDAHTAVSVSSSNRNFHDLSFFDYTIIATADADHEDVARQAETIFNRLLEEGPTQDEIDRAVSLYVLSQIKQFETVSGRSIALAEGQIDLDDPDFYQKKLQAYAALNPDQIRNAMRRWLTRPAYTQYILPGEREPYAEAAANPSGAIEDVAAPPIQRVERAAPPSLGDFGKVNFPTTERAVLLNGMEVIYARSATVPMTKIAVEFDAGVTADSPNRLGVHGFMLDLLAEGTTTQDPVSLQQAEERSGSNISISPSMDRSSIALETLSTSLSESLPLLSDVIRNPAFDPAAVEKIRARRASSLEREKTSPQALARNTILPIIYGQNHTYSRSPSGTGTADAISTVSRDELVLDHQKWIRPDNAKIFVVSDLPLSEVVEHLNREFGGWTAPSTAKGKKQDIGPIPTPTAPIILIDRPQSPQSLIYAGQVFSQPNDEEMLSLRMANSILGLGNAPRIERELRVKRGWSYHPYSLLVNNLGQPYLMINASVQADKTGESIQVLQGVLNDAFTVEKISEDEYLAEAQSNIRALPGTYATSASILSALKANNLNGRPDDYQQNTPLRIGATSTESLNSALTNSVKPDKFVWVIVGDAAIVRPQLEAAGLEFELRPAN